MKAPQHNVIYVHCQSFFFLRKCRFIRSFPGLALLASREAHITTKKVGNASGTILFIFHGSTALVKRRSPHCRGFTNTLRHTTLGRTPQYECSVRHRDLYLTTHNIYKREISMLPAIFEPTFPARERPQTHTLDRAASGIHLLIVVGKHIKNCKR
jgi:hypothetical protein